VHDAEPTPGWRAGRRAAEIEGLCPPGHLAALRPPNSLRRRLRGLRPLGLTTALVFLLTGCAAPVHADPPRPRAASDTPDAVFELWEQHWTLNPDGSQVYHEKQHVRLNADRVFGTFGDARITFNAATDEVEVLQARTRLPDGRYVELAPYSTVEVAPDAAAGWPAFSSLRQRVMVMGGIEAGCVLETEYRIRTRAGARAALAADLRIDHEYPVRARTITVTLPPGCEIAPVLTGLPDDAYLYSFEQRSDGTSRHRWDFAALDGRPAESQALPWQEAGVRLAFSTAGAADAWLGERLAAVDAAAGESALLSKLADEWTAGASTDGDRLRALQSRLADTFNFVHFDPDWQPPLPRPAADVIQHNYGLPAEAAAVLLALARAAGIAVQPGLLVADHVWLDDAPQPGMIAAYVVVHEGANGREVWHPQHGRIRRDRRWAGHTLIVSEEARITRTTLPAWLDPGESRCAVTGSISIAEDGKYAGQLHIRTCGLFVAPGELETREGQKRRIEHVVRHVLPEANVGDFTLRSLTPEVFEVAVEIKSGEPLKKLHDCYQLVLAETFPALADVPLPTAHSQRLTAARLVGPFDESVELSVSWPQSWKVDAVPGELSQASEGCGLVWQRVTATEQGMRLARRTQVTRRDLPPEAVLALRSPVNELRSAHARTLLLRP